MQAVCSTSLCTPVKGVSLSRRAPSNKVCAGRPAVRVPVVCAASPAHKVAAIAAALPAGLAVHPALALVDDRLNGDGTGKILGVGAGPEGWAILLVFSLIWALFYIAGRDIGDGPPKRGTGDDSGLSL